MITFPLRHLATRLAATICGNFLGMDVHSEGTQLFNSAHTFQYEVAAACSGLRSFIAILVLTIIYAFMCFNQSWKRVLVVLSAFPLAVAGNVLRLMCIVVSASIWGRSTGDYVHDNLFFSLSPSVPAILGVMLCWAGGWVNANPNRRRPPRLQRNLRQYEQTKVEISFDWSVPDRRHSRDPSFTCALTSGLASARHSHLGNRREQTVGHLHADQRPGLCGGKDCGNTQRACWKACRTTPVSGLANIPSRTNFNYS